MRRLFLALLVLSLFVLPLAAADITGKWTGTVEFKAPDGNVSASTAYADFRQNGEKITGEAGESEQNKSAIEKGRLAGNLLTLEVTLTDDSGNHLYKVSAKVVSADRIEGSVETPGPDGKMMPGQIVLTRNKS